MFWFFTISMKATVHKIKINSADMFVRNNIKNISWPVLFSCHTYLLDKHSRQGKLQITNPTLFHQNYHLMKISIFSINITTWIFSKSQLPSKIHSLHISGRLSYENYLDKSVFDSKIIGLYGSCVP